MFIVLATGCKIVKVCSILSHSTKNAPRSKKFALPGDLMDTAARISGHSNSSEIRFRYQAEDSPSEKGALAATSFYGGQL